MAEDVARLSLTDQGRGEVELRYWRDDPNRYASRRLLAAEIDDLAAKAEAD